MLSRTIEYQLNENWNDGFPKLADFDIITRRYLEFCAITGYNVEDYIPGLIQEELDEHFRGLSKERDRTSS